MEIVKNQKNEAIDDENIEKIKIIDLIIHKKWKYKIKGYEKLHSKIINNECIKLESEFFNINIKKLLNNSVTEVLKSILLFFTNCFFNENIKNILLNNYDYIFKILLEKYFSLNKLNIKKLCFNLFNLIFNNFDTKLFYDNLWIAWNPNNFKINYLAFNLIYMLIEENNIKNFKIKLFFKNMDKLINSPNQELRNNIIALIKLLVKNYGLNILDVFKNIKKVLVDNIKKDYLKNGKTTENNNLDDLYDVIEEVNIFSKYNDIWFENLLKIKKWNEKKILLEELIKNSNKPKLAYSTNITKILQLIKKILIDKHIQVKILIIKFMGNLCIGLRKKIEKIWKSNIIILLNKLKEKNTVLIETILDSFKKLFYSIDLIDYSLELKELINNKNSYLNHNILKLMIIYYRFCLKNDKNICIFFNTFNNNIKELLKDKNHEVKKLLNNFLKNEIKLAENQELAKIINNLLGNKTISTNPINLNIITENIKNNYNIPEIQNKSIWNLIKYLNSKKILNTNFYKFLSEFFDKNFKTVNNIVLKSSLIVFSIISFKYFIVFKNIIKINLPKILYFIVDKNVDIKKFIKEFIAKISENKELRIIFIFSVNNIIKNKSINNNLKIKILKYFNKYIIINDKDNKSIIIELISNSLFENCEKIVEISKLICKQFLITFCKNDKFIDEIKNNKNIPIKSRNKIIIIAKSLNINNNNLLISKNNIKVINHEEQNFYKFLENKNNFYNIDKNVIINNFINFNEPNDTEIYFITNNLKEYFKYIESNPFNTYQSENLINLIETIINYKNLDDIKDMLLWYIYIKLYDCNRKLITEILIKLVEKLINNIKFEVEICIVKLVVNIIILIFKKNINKHTILDLLVDFNDNFIFDYIISLKIYIDTNLNIINYLINKFKSEVLVNENHIITLISLYLKNKKLIFTIFENWKKNNNKYFLNILDSNNNVIINNFFKEINWESIVKNFIKNINILIDFDKYFTNEIYTIENIDYYSEIIMNITNIINNLTSDYRIHLFINFTDEFIFVYTILSKLLTSNLYCLNIELDNLKNIIQNTIILLYLTKTDLNNENYNFINNKDFYIKYEKFNININNILLLLIKKLDYNLVLEIIFELLIYFNYNDIENKISYICIVLKLWNKFILIFIDKFDTIDYIKTFDLFNLYFYKLINLNEQLNEIINNLLIDIKKNENIFNLLKSKINTKYLENNYYNWESEIKIIESLMTNNINEFNEFLNDNYNNIKLNIDKFKNIITKIENDNKWNLFIKKN